MNLRATINGKQYDILQGATFAEEFNETLDSGSIVISGVEKINDLLPYDDVYIYSFDDPNYEFQGYPFDTNNPQPKFYKHLLVDQFTEEVLRLGDELGAGTYKYKIELMSETKKLETIQLPNISITQPIKGTKTSVWEYVQNFIYIYSPQYKKRVVSIGGKVSWVYTRKYKLDTKLKSIFENIFAPDFVLNAPSLRALLSKFFLVKDIIPYVKDDVIYGMDISKRNGKFNADKRYVNIITGTRTSDNHCDNLRRNYSDALVQDRTCRSVEYVGFRNSDNALMTISNMRLELGMPIYKIRKIYLCYYKDIKVTYPNTSGVEDGVMLCKQDITKLVKLNTERNLLSKDWENLQDKTPPKSVDEMAQYKYCTVGYDIGSRYITGWGDMYTYPTFWNDNKFTSVQNIVSKMDYFYPFGIYNAQYVAKQFGEGCTVYSSLDTTFWSKLISDSFGGNSNDTVNTFFSTVESPFTNASLKLKGLFFMVDYEGFYNGAIVHSKKNHRDDITINDNASESLTLVEQDAIFQNEKVNRFGNKALQINARYDTFYDPTNGEELLQPLASVYSSKYEDDVVIYHREYSIYNNCVQCIYYGIKNYVLKNWFTSVYAKYRTWNLMSYNESIRRAENEKEYIYWSDNEVYYEDPFLFRDYTSKNSTVLADIISCFSTWNKENIVGVGEFLIDKKINSAFIMPRATETGGLYSSDLNAFVANNSMCFNLKMNDNFSQGVYISKAEPFIGGRYNDDYTTGDGKHSVGDEITKENWVKQTWDFFTTPANSDYSGSKQDYYSLVDEMGQTEFMAFYVAHMPQNTLDIWQSTRPKIDENNPAITKGDLSKIVNSRYNKIFAIPKHITGNFNAMSQIIGIGDNFFKDNKSYIDMTLQIENLTMSNDIILSPWVMKLSDLLGDYPKFDRTIEDKSTPLTGSVQCITSEFLSSGETRVQDTVYPRPGITLKFSKAFIDSVQEEKPYTFNHTLMFSLSGFDLSDNGDAAAFWHPTKGQVFLLYLHCEQIYFYHTLTTLELRGKLTMGYQSGDAGSYQLIQNKPFVFFLSKMDKQNSIVGSIMPDADQSKEKYGKSLNESIVYYSNIMNTSYTWEQVYGKNSLKFPYLPGDFIGGTETNADYSQYLLGRGFFYGHLYFKDANDNNVYIPPKDSTLPLRHYIKGNLKQGIYDLSTQAVKWNENNVTALHNIVSNGEIAFGDSLQVTYATYHKNMFLRYDTENFLDPQALKDSYKYSEIKNSKDFNFESPVSNYFVSQLSDAGTPYIEIPSIYKVIFNAQNKVTDRIWRDSKIPLSADDCVINGNDIYFTKQDNKEELQNKFLIVAPDKNNPELINVFWGNDYDAEGELFSIQSTDTYSATKLKALSFWYLDDSQNGYTTSVDSMGYVSKFDYNPDNCYCHFVFGVNIDDNFSRKIYLSMLKKKDLRVFDEYHQVIGASKNYLKPDGTIDTDENTGYATGQFFTEKK